MIIQQHFLYHMQEFLWRKLFVADGFFENTDEKDPQKLKAILVKKFPKLNKLEKMQELSLEFKDITSTEIEGFKTYFLNYDSRVPDHIFHSPLKYLREKGIAKKSPEKNRYIEDAYRSPDKAKEIKVHIKDGLHVKINFISKDLKTH